MYVFQLLMLPCLFFLLGTGILTAGSASAVSNIFALGEKSELNHISRASVPDLLILTEKNEIQFRLSQPAFGTFEILTTEGSIVRRLQVYSKGIVSWDRRDSKGRQVPGGIYIVRLSSREATINQILLLTTDE